MRPLLEKRFLRLEHTKTEILKAVSGKSFEDFNYSEKPGQWSPAQIICHLILGEELTVAYMKLKIQDKTLLPDASFVSTIKSFVLRIALRSSMKFKAPDFTTRIPATIEYDQLETRWNKVREDLKQLLESLPEELMSKAIFKHPVAGRMNIFCTLSFLDDHCLHHNPQIIARLKNR